MLRISIWMLMFAFAFSAHAKRFANGYAEFELPQGWQCAIEGSEWVCQSENKDRQKEAIIILAAKKRGAQDTLEAYQAYLKQTKTYQLPGAKEQRSEPKSVDTNVINGHNWVDALHLASEVPGFYTRYLATVKADIGVAVTFSVTKSMYNAYKGIFDNVINSMRIFRQLNTNLAGIKKGNSGEDFVDAAFEPTGDDLNIAAVASEKRKKAGGGTEDLLVFALIGAVAAFALFKMKKGKKKGSKKKNKNV